MFKKSFLMDESFACTIFSLEDLSRCNVTNVAESGMMHF